MGHQSGLSGGQPERTQPTGLCLRKPSPQTCQSNPTLPLGVRVMLDLLVLLRRNFTRELGEPIRKEGGPFLLGMPVIQPPWNEALKGSTGILISKGALVWKGCGTRTQLAWSSTPGTFSAAAKHCLKSVPHSTPTYPLPTVIKMQQLPSAFALTPLATAQLAPGPLWGWEKNSRVLLQVQAHALILGASASLPWKELCVHTATRNVGIYQCSSVPLCRRGDSCK